MTLIQLQRYRSTDEYRHDIGGGGVTFEPYLACTIDTYTIQDEVRLHRPSHVTCTHEKINASVYIHNLRVHSICTHTHTKLDLLSNLLKFGWPNNYNLVNILEKNHPLPSLTPAQLSRSDIMHGSFSKSRRLDCVNNPPSSI